jgi:hypothetical protein
MRLQAPQANDLADGLWIADIRTAERVIAALRVKLQGDSTSTG